jgi:hypothetical protein
MSLYTNCKWLEKLQHSSFHVESCGTTILCTLKPDKLTGKLKPTGSSALKESQAYPQRFGEAIADLFHKHRKMWRASEIYQKKCACLGSCPTARAILQRPMPMDPESSWDDADLGRVLALAEKHARQNCQALVTDVVDLID